LLHLVGSSVLLYLRNNIYSKKFSFTLVVHKESENENLNGNQWLFYCIATSDCCIALKPVTVLLHCNQWLFYCIATSDCCIALQPVTVVLHCNQWLLYCIATSDCCIALQPVTVVLHCNQWLLYCIATSKCCIALQPVTVVLHCPNIVIKTKVAVLNSGKRTKWTLKIFLLFL